MKRHLHTLSCALVCAFFLFTSRHATARSAEDTTVIGQPTRAFPDSSIQVKFDPRIELFSIIFRLAGNNEYNDSQYETYTSDIDAHFGSFRDHPAIAYARKLNEDRGIGYDAPMSLAAHLSEVPNLQELVLLEGASLDERWETDEAIRFIELARSFVADTDFEGFIRSHQSLYEMAESRMQTAVKQDLNAAWFGDFFGRDYMPEFVVAVSLANAGSYGARVNLADTPEKYYVIQGTWRIDDEGHPIYNEQTSGSITTLLCGLFANDFIDQHIDDLREPAERILLPIGEQLHQGYRHWESILRRSVSQAVSARYILAQQGAVAAHQEIEYGKEIGFLWVGELFALLGVYEHSRQRYEDFESFLPNITAYFHDLASRIDGVLAASKASTREPRPITLMDCDQESTLKSQDSTERSFLLLLNERSENIQVHWLDYAGKRELYDTVEPGETFTSKSYSTDPWVVTNEQGECIATFLTSEAYGLAVIR